MNRIAGWLRNCLAALALPALWIAPAAAQPSGEAAYAEACAECHRTPSRLMRRYRDMTAERRAAELDRVLAEHHAPDAAKRAAIIAWLEANHAGR